MSLWRTVHLQLSSIHSFDPDFFSCSLFLSCCATQCIKRKPYLSMASDIGTQFFITFWSRQIMKKMKIGKMEKTKDHRMASHRSSCIFIFQFSVVIGWYFALHLSMSIFIALLETQFINQSTVWHCCHESNHTKSMRREHYFRWIQYVFGAWNTQWCGMI